MIEQLATGNAAYSLPQAWRLRGALDERALRQGFDDLIRRHETLRTIFPAKGGRPVQLLRQPGTFALEEQDLSGESDPMGETRRILAAEARRPFDLSAGPLARAHLLRLDAEDYVLLINLHHIISDEWSLGILTRDLAGFYASRLAGVPAGLPELAVQYADFCVWQRQDSQTRVNADLEYWRQSLRSPLPQLQLPADRPRPARFTWKGRTIFDSLPAELLPHLKDLSRRQGATLFMILLSAFKVLLHRYTRQTDIIVGSPFAGRNHPETENLIGLFVNTCALRTDVSGDPTFAELVARVRETVLRADAHQSASIEQIIEAVHPARDASRHPLFQVVFGLQPGQAQQWSLPGITVTAMDIENGTAKFDWTLLLVENGDTLRLRSEYNSDVIDAATAEGLLRHFKVLLRSIVEKPSAHISELPLLDPAEQSCVLSEGNNAQPSTSPAFTGNSIQGLFEARAEVSPHATAMSFGEQRFTYAELNRRANQVAHQLLQSGAGASKPVALFLERSADLVVAILAVLKAGSPYVPIDPASPPERFNFILEDTKAAILITGGSSHPPLAGSGPRVINLNSIRSAAEAANPPDQTKAADPAYIIYTSGSTGRPKGVVVTHHNVIRLFQQTEHWFSFTPDDVWTLFHSYAFDFSVWEIWGALLYGGRLVIVPYLTSRSPTEFYQLLAREKVTVLNQTPSAFRQLIWAESDRPTEERLALRYVIFGGEALELQTLKPWFERHGDQAPQLVNMYGITETTVHVTCRFIRRQDLENGEGSVIGAPIPDLKLYLLDEHLQPVPLGVPGEICVSGAGVAHGYLNRPDLTAQRFVPEPFSLEPGMRLYRSGDLARRTSRGELVYLGRIDHQVKIRGFRVELGEIESCLNRHPSVRESVVVAEELGESNKRLVAYVVPSGPPPAAAVLQEHLGRTLPDYMIPAVIIPLKSLPLTGNGKVDRGALPAAGRETLPRATPVPPRTETEAAILKIWSEVLGRQDLGVDDNFFHLGGHSLLAMQVISRIGANLGAELSVATLFEQPTVAGLARVVSQEGHAMTDSTPILPVAELESAEQLQAEVDDLTDTQVEQLLTRLSP